MPAVHGKGPLNAQLMFVGAAPAAEEVFRGEPFVGYSGDFLNKMLASLGVARSDVYVTNVAREQPPSLPGGGQNIAAFFESMPKPTSSRPKPIWVPGPPIRAGLERLKLEVELVQPKLIVPMGDVALWAIEGSQKIGTWRGSLLRSRPEYGGRRVVPTWHPAFVLRSMAAAPEMRADIERAIRFARHDGEDRPRRYYTVRPTLDQVRRAIFECVRRRRFAADIETRGGEISCIGFAWARNEGICIPFIDSKTPDGAYWSFEEELAVWQLVQWAMLHPDSEVIMQNASYEASYFAARRGWLPRPAWDTMSMHHVIFAGMEKSLDYMASLYAEYYKYWKDQGREWDNTKPEEQHWEYNIDDCCYTFEIAQVLIDKLLLEGLMPQYRNRQDRLWRALQFAMLKGMNASKERIAELIQELFEFATTSLDQIKFLLGHDLNPDSIPQMRALLYEDFGLPPVTDRKTGNLTTRDDALDLCMQRMPMLKPLLWRIKDYRSATTLLSNLGVGKHGESNRRILDADGRCRFNINMDGTETYRTSSSKNNFGTGMNGQNLTKGDDDDLTAHNHGRLVAPNLRTMFIPDEGHELADIDLKRADLVVVAKEARDVALLQQLQQGYNPYLIATAQFLKLPLTKEGLAEAKERHGVRYTLFKSFFHGTNYGGSVPTMAANCNITRSEAAMLQAWWFKEHPGILERIQRIKAQLEGRREVRNAFGLRRRYFDRPEGVLGKALAWSPQSTVAIVSLEQFVRVFEAWWDRTCAAFPLLQVHDSIVVQYPIAKRDETLRTLRRLMVVEIPYPDGTLVLQPSLATSTKSWGEVKDREWPV